MSRARDIANLGNNTTNLETLDTLYGDNVLTGRNLIINGAFSIFQRGTSATTVNGNDIFAADRFKGWANGGGTFTVEQSTDVPNNEFEFSAKLTNTATDGSVAAGDNYRWATDLEGYTVSRLAYGHSDAKAVTLSFWVKSSLTGTYCGALYSTTASRHYIYEYTISSANTWEKKTITITSGDTTGSWNKTNGNGLRIYWGFGSGSTYQGTAGAWTAGEKWETSNQAAWIGSASATFYITGIQLEVGETATPFEHRSYGDELRRCQRYYEKSFPQGVTPAQNSGVKGHCLYAGSNDGGSILGFKPYTVEKRASATVVGYNPNAANANFSNGGSPVYNNNDATGFSAYTTTTTGSRALLNWTADAEL